MSTTSNTDHEDTTMDDKLDVLQTLFHTLDKKLERLLALQEGRDKRDEDVECRLKAVEGLAANHDNALRIVRWVGSTALSVVMLVMGYLVKLGLDTMRDVVRLIHK